MNHLYVVIFYSKGSGRRKKTPCWLIGNPNMVIVGRTFPSIFLTKLANNALKDGDIVLIQQLDVRNGLRRKMNCSLSCIKSMEILGL